MELEFNIQFADLFNIETVSSSIYHRMPFLIACPEFRVHDLENDGAEQQILIPANVSDVDSNIVNMFLKIAMISAAMTIGILR